LYDQGQVALEFHQTGTGTLDAEDLRHRYLWNPEAVDQLLADEQVDWSDDDADGEVLWALTDILGSVRDVVDANSDHRIYRRFDAFGRIVDETHFDASGDIVAAGQPGYVNVAFAFTGRWYDKTTGLQNNHNRWYDPKTGRWLSEDPIGFEAGDANLYRYVGNSPTNGMDPTGTAIFVYPEQKPWPRPGWLPGWVPWPYDEEGIRRSRENFDPSDLVCPLGIGVFQNMH
jgi:RHS repeat-associated protein